VGDSHSTLAESACPVKAWISDVRRGILASQTLVKWLNATGVVIFSMVHPPFGESIRK